MGLAFQKRKEKKRRNGSIQLSMGEAMASLQLKDHVLGSNEGLIDSTFLQVMLRQPGVHPERGRRHENVPVRVVESDSCSTAVVVLVVVVLMVPIEGVPVPGRGGGWIRLAGEHGCVLRRQRLLVVGGRASRVVEIDGGYVVDARSPLVFSTGELADEVLLSMTSYLSWSSSYHKIP